MALLGASLMVMGDDSSSYATFWGHSPVFCRWPPVTQRPPVNSIFTQGGIADGYGGYQDQLWHFWGHR
jgi:hypothetical protein